MFGMRWRVFRLLGIPVFIDASWLVVFFLLTLSLRSLISALLQAYLPEIEWANHEFWVLALIAAIGFFGCVFLHELGHAVVARSHGVPIRGITLFLFGGVAEMGEEPVSARSEFLMAAAGPIVSVVLSVSLGLLAMVGVDAHWPNTVVILLGYLAFINAALAAFNLVPAFPLDGGRMFRALLWGASGDLPGATRWAILLGHVFASLLIAGGIILLFGPHWLSGVWVFVVGLYLNSAAEEANEELVMLQTLRGEPITRFMNRTPITVSPLLDLRHLADDFVGRYHHRTFPVASNGHLEGIVNTRALARVPRHDWPQHTVGEVMRHDFGALTIPLGADALEALAEMKRTGFTALLVTDGDRLVGLVTLKDVVRFLELKLEMAHSGVTQ